MQSFKKPTSGNIQHDKVVFRLPSAIHTDKNMVRIGGQAPAFRILSVKDEGKVRLGGQGPIFR